MDTNFCRGILQMIGIALIILALACPGFQSDPVLTSSRGLKKRVRDQRHSDANQMKFPGKQESRRLMGGIEKEHLRLLYNTHGVNSDPFPRVSSRLKRDDTKDGARTPLGSKDSINHPSKQNDASTQSDTGLCPLTCSCKVIFSELAHSRLSGVDCSDLQIERLPESMPFKVQLLKLSGNRINVVQLGDLRQFPKLVELHLESNHIYNIENWVLSSDKLRYMVLDGNEIDYLGNATFTGMGNLLRLSLSRNQIELIHNGAFLGLRKLETLVMTSNRIGEIDVRWFRHLSNLKQLGLAGNSIHTLLDQNFYNLPKLETLDMSGNHLRMIHDKAFAGLNKLKQLYLQSNSLHVLPTTALQVFVKCDIIDLSNNHFEIIDYKQGIINTNVTHLKLNSIGQLVMVDTHSFRNLPFLQVLEVSNNPNLQYIDRQAFSQVPVLEVLLLADNSLSTLEKEITVSLPTLRIIDLHNNPLYCDCALLWVRNTGFLRSRNLTFVNASDTVCHQPNGLKNLRVSDPNLTSIGDSCPPRILALFKDQYNLSLGDSLEISCKATGYPAPSIQWYLPSNHKRKLDKVSGQAASKDDASAAVRHTNSLLQGDQLEIEFADEKDAGNYSCVGKNSEGIASKDVVVQILLSSAYLIISHVTSTSVTLMWGRTHHARDYGLLYKVANPLGSNSTYHSQGIHPYMRSYTASELQPSTKYQFCLSVTFKDKHIPINCTFITTKEANFVEKGLHNSKNYVIGGAIAVLVCVIIIICSAGHISRRYNKKRQREQKFFSDSLSQLYPASLDSISDTTPITYENKIAELFDIEDPETAGVFPSTSNSDSLQDDIEEYDTNTTPA